MVNLDILNKFGCTHDRLGKYSLRQMSHLIILEYEQSSKT